MNAITKPTAAFDENTLIALDNLPTSALLAQVETNNHATTLELVLAARLRAAWDELTRIGAERAELMAA